jgi:hypothetical protein
MVLSFLVAWKIGGESTPVWNCGFLRVHPPVRRMSITGGIILFDRGHRPRTKLKFLEKYLSHCLLSHGSHRSVSPERNWASEFRKQRHAATQLPPETCSDLHTYLVALRGDSIARNGRILSLQCEQESLQTRRFVTRESQIS